VIVDVEVQRTAKALDQRDRPGPGCHVGMPRFLDQVRDDDTVDDYFSNSSSKRTTLPDHV